MKLLASSTMAAIVIVAGAATAQAADSSASSSSGTSQDASQMNMRQEIKSQLSKDGYTSVNVMPSSFYVRATSKQGQPVAMVISPDSVTEVTEIPANNASGKNNTMSGGTKTSTSTQK